MASPLYDNKYLADREAKRKLGVTIAPPESAQTPVGPDPKDALLAGAKASLARADAFAADQPVSALSNLESRLASLSQGRADVKQPGRDISALGYLNPALAPLLLPGIMDPAEGESSLGNAGAAGLSLMLGSGVGNRLIGKGAKAVGKGVKKGVGAVQKAVRAPAVERAAEVTGGRPIGMSRFGGESKLAGDPADAWLQMGNRTQLPEKSIDDVLQGFRDRNAAREIARGETNRLTLGSESTPPRDFMGMGIPEERLVPPSSHLDDFYPPEEQGLANLDKYASQGRETDLTSQIPSRAQDAAEVLARLFRTNPAGRPLRSEF